MNYGLKFSTLAAVFALLSGCGAPSAPPKSSAHLAPVCLACPASAPPVTVPVNPYLNAGMIGQPAWILQNANASCTTWIQPLAVPPSNYYPAGSLMLRITKSAPQCYWSPGDAGAWIDYPVSPSPLNDGSMASRGFVSHNVSWCPFNPCSQEIQTSIPGGVIPYMAAPAPSLKAGSVQIFDTAYAVWNFNGENFNSFDFGPPANPSVPWRTVFSIEPNGWAKVEAFEGQCGHEVSYLSNRGIERIEFPNDRSAGCVPNPPSTTITRVN